MTESERATAELVIVLMENGRWRVFLNEQDLNASFQFPWDALQCALNGSLTGRPIQGLRSIYIRVSSIEDQTNLERARKTDEEQRRWLSDLRGIDGDGI
jgi:hypothetical protein